MNFEKCLLQSSKKRGCCKIIAVSPKTLASNLAELSPVQKKWVQSLSFKANPSQMVVVPDRNGKPEMVLFGVGDSHQNSFSIGGLPSKLPAGSYCFGDGFDDLKSVTLAFLLGCYDFDRYRENPRDGKISLLCPASQDRLEILRIADAVKLTRDLINTPANDMGPQELQAAAMQLAKKHKAKLTIIKGAALKKGFPMIHAVGRASRRQPLLIDLTWGAARHAKVTLVGKGVVFDTGGLDIKPSSGMILMKKDMGGAANVLGLAAMIMDAKLPVRLRVLIPAVENAVGGDAYRPSDILASRKGLTVEVGNTDAEGRLVLADALALADEEKPELLIDMATLTGAARVALGPDLPPYYCDDDEIADAIMKAGTKTGDSLWRMPYWRDYEKMLSSKVADISSTGSGFGGSITAALFLNKFVEKAVHHIHFDIYGWTPSAKPGRPVGGEAQGIRALYEFLSARYGT